MIENRPKADLVGLTERSSVNLQVLCTLGNKLFKVAIPLPFNVLTQTFIFVLLGLLSVVVFQFLRCVISVCATCGRYPLFKPNINLDLCGDIYARFQLICERVLIMNAVDVLLNKSFSSLSAEGKLEIKCLGPHRPSPVISFLHQEVGQRLLCFRQTGSKGQSV